MKDILPLAERLSPDNVVRLEKAAHQRFTTAEILRAQDRRLAALYFYGYSAEMWLAAAYFRSARFGENQTIDRDTRHRRMVQARQLRSEKGSVLMNGDPHPLVGWAAFLKWQRMSAGQLSPAVAQRLNEAINKAIVIYNYWRPELRYKVIDITEDQLAVVVRAASWLKNNHRRLSEA